MNEHDNRKSEFREVFLEHLRIMQDKQLDRMIRFKQRPIIRDMLQSNTIPRMVLVKTVIESLNLYPNSADYIFTSLLRYAIDPTNSEIDSYYPELIWLIHKSDLLSKRDTTEDIFEIARTLLTLTNHKFARSYLNFLILTDIGNASEKIIPAYYYTHHDIDSLRLVFPYISDDNPKLSQNIYSNALIFVANLEGQHMSVNDEGFLIQFFETGLVNSQESIVEVCKQALERLRE